MSLPTAPKDISEKPRSGAVTDPVNKAQKDADVDRKLRFYGVIEAFRQGRYPDNSQIDQTLAYVHDNSFLDISKLSADGKRLIQDVRDIIETAREIVKQKNADELFQNFMWHTRGVDTNRLNQDHADISPVDQGKVKQDGERAVQHLRTLFSLLFTNSEARKLLADFSVIGRDLFARGAAKAADLACPDPERLAKVDDPAPSRDFSSEGGRKVTPESIIEGRIPAPGQNDSMALPQHLVDNPASSTHTKGDVAGANSVVERADVVKQGFRERLAGMRDNLMDRVPQEHKDKAADNFDKTKYFLTEEYFPEERRDQFLYRAKKVIVECQQHDDYQAAVRWLLETFEDYRGHAGTIASKGVDAQKKLDEDGPLNQALLELTTLLERFANGRSFDEIHKRIDVVFQDAREDEELRDWFKKLDSFARRALLEPGFVLQEQCNKDAKDIRDAGRGFYEEKYKDHFDSVFSSIGDFFSSMGDDPLNSRFGQDWARLTKDLLFDTEGSLKYKPELWSDIKSVVLPAVVDHVGYVPIPRVEYTDDTLDLVIENLTLSGRNLFPNFVTIDAHNHMKFSPYNSIMDETHHDFTIHFSQVQADMRDVAFYFHKKTGPIKIRDSGLADVILGGGGLSGTVRLTSPPPNDTSSVFKVKEVHVKVDTLKFSIRDSKHDTLYNTLRPLATGLVKKQIKKALEGAMKTGLEYVDGQLVAVRNRMDEAKKTDEGGRMKALQELFQRKKDEAESMKSSPSGTGGQFKVVSKRDSALLPDVGHKNVGWMYKQQEQMEIASKGEGWKSDAFTII